MMSKVQHERPHEVRIVALRASQAHQYMESLAQILERLGRAGDSLSDFVNETLCLDAHVTEVVERVYVRSGPGRNGWRKAVGFGVTRSLPPVTPVVGSFPAEVVKGIDGPNSISDGFVRPVDFRSPLAVADSKRKGECAKADRRFRTPRFLSFLQF